MAQAGSGLELIAWQGWSVTGSIAALLILLITILLWLLPFPSNPLAAQLADAGERAHLHARLGGASSFERFRIAVERFKDWLARWFGRSWSGQAFERCVAIAFVFPVALFLLATILSGYKNGQVGFGELLLFLFGAAIVAAGLRVLFHFGYWFARRMWHSIGGDAELAEIIARVVLGAFAVVFAFAIAFAVASSLAGEATGAGTIAFAMLGGFAFAMAFAIAFAFAGVWAFLIALALVTVIALTMAKDFAFFLLLFFVILPVLNALMDWVSWAVTRFHLTVMGSAAPGIAGASLIAAVLVADVAAAALLVIALAVLLPIGLELADLLLSVFGRDSFDWRSSAAQAVRSPWEEGLFVTGMLLTPLVPTIALLTVGLAALAAPFTPGARAGAEALAASEGGAVAGPDLARGISRIVYLTRLWYLPASIVAVGVFVAIWWALSLAGVPVASFLEALALCSTVWGHGQCPWL
jgi:hypothetical protein